MKAGVLRHVAPVKQMPFTWLLTVLSCALFVLTVLYAFETTLFSNNLSAGNVILIIRVLSGLASFFMSTLVVSAFDRVRWMLVATRKGSNILDFLTLSSGTGALAWLAVGFGKGKSMLGSRAWAYSRILALLLVNALGIIILSDVSTETSYINHGTFAVTAGIGAFTPSFAADDAAKLVTGIYMATDFSGYLADSAHAYPTIPVTPQPSSCTLGSSSHDCIISYFATGGLASIAPWPSNIQSDFVSPVYTVFDSAGYQFDFSSVDQSVQFEDTDCIHYGNNDSGFIMCLKTSEKTTLNARFQYCALGACASRSQNNLTSLALSVRAYNRQATVHYSRLNSSILSIDSLSTPLAVELEPSSLFQVYNNTFNTVGSIGEVTSGQQFQQFLGNWLFSSSATRQNPSSTLKPLQNLLILPLVYFQPNYMNPKLQPSPDSPAPDLPDDLNSKASLSETRNRLVVASWSLITYTALGAAILITCLVVIVLGSLQATAGNVPDVSPWPVLDLALVRGENEEELSYTSGREKTNTESRVAEQSGLIETLRASQVEEHGKGLMRRLSSLRIYARAE